MYELQIILRISKLTQQSSNRIQAKYTSVFRHIVQIYPCFFIGHVSRFLSYLIVAEQTYNSTNNQDVQALFLLTFCSSSVSYAMWICILYSGSICYNVHNCTTLYREGGIFMTAALI